ncbi:MAG: hypothetical protein ABFS56_22015 [Pseudomonadota bacterium]
MNKHETISKIAFFVGSEVDDVIITTFAKQLLPSCVYFHTIQMSDDIAAFHAAAGVITDLLPRDYQHFFILFDTNTTDEYQITYYQNIIAEPIQKNGLLNYVTFCPIVPNIGAWLLDKYDLPKKQFDQEFDLPQIEKVARCIDINVLKRKNASFNQLALALQTMDIQKLAA